ncbi:MAG: hypothetical protein NC489_08185 [Ruminococcus flavefaciens]|nr:hypothetical protein [Ruminococcus flavefaciens]
MAILSQRLHRLGDTGYDVLHFETESKIVLRPDGTDMETAFQKLEKRVLELSPKVVSSTPSALNPGTIAIVGDSIYIGDANGVPLQIAGPDLQVEEI